VITKENMMFLFLFFGKIEIKGDDIYIPLIENWHIGPLPVCNNLQQVPVID
jgi:hypothetical protein